MKRKDGLLGYKRHVCKTLLAAHRKAARIAKKAGYYPSIYRLPKWVKRGKLLKLKTEYLLFEPRRVVNKKRTKKVKK